MPRSTTRHCVDYWRLGCEAGAFRLHCDLYSVFATFLPGILPDHPPLSPSTSGQVPGRGEPRLRAVIEGLQQRANEGEPFPEAWA